MSALLAQAEFVRPPIDWHAAAPELTLLAFGALLTMMDIGWLERGRRAAAPMASIALQYGVPLKALVDKFSHTRFEPSGFTSQPL